MFELQQILQDLSRKQCPLRYVGFLDDKAPKASRFDPSDGDACIWTSPDCSSGPTLEGAVSRPQEVLAYQCGYWLTPDEAKSIGQAALQSFCDLMLNSHT